MALLAAAAALLALIGANNAPAWTYFARGLGDWGPGFMMRTAVLPAAAAAAAVAFGGILGRRLLRLARIAPGPDAPALALGLGVGALGLGAVILAFAGRLSLAGFAALGAALLAVAAPEMRLAAAAVGRLRAREIKPLPAAAGVVLAFAAWNAFVCAAAPQTEWDVLTYHLAIPKLYLRAGGLSAPPWLLYARWPHMMEVLYALPLALGCDQGAALFHASLCGALVWAVFASARRELSPAAAWTAAALLAAEPVLLGVAPQAHSDGALALFHFLSALALWEWSKKRATGALVVAGLLSGLGVSCKLHGLVLAAALTAWAVLRPAPPRERLRAGLIFLACVLGVSWPWFLRTLLETGNPVWPFYAGLIGGSGGALALLKMYEGSLFWRFPQNIPQLLNYGPQYLLVPLAVLLPARRRPLPEFVKFLWIAPLVLLAATLRYRDVWRFFLPGMPAAALTAACWAEDAFRRGGWRKAAAAAAVAFGVWPALRENQNNELFPVLGVHSQAEPGENPRTVYLERKVDSFRFLRRVNALGVGGKTLFVLDDRGYYFDAPYEWASPTEQAEIDYAALPDAAALLARLKELGITHVFVDEGNPTFGYDDRHFRALIAGALSTGARPLLRDGGLSFHALR